jgi:putative transposase|tara:strand:- start:1171 stop:1629 length:459 start_codon:yes stop_codon:yes gene_type:complete
MESFERIRLKHGIPSWVEDGATYFITINAAARRTNQLARPATAEAIKQAIQVYTESSKWYPKLAVVMPDHLHLLVSLNTAQFSISQIISPWKSYLKKSQDIQWQEGFFEHRIRDRASLEGKEDYLRMNPVRADLVKIATDWPYTWSESEFQR